MFYIIALTKWIIFLKISVCRVNDSSMVFTREGTYILSPIQWKAYAKLLKQQLLYVFWWYFITGAAGWNCTFLAVFALPSLLQIFDMFLLIVLGSYIIGLFLFFFILWLLSADYNQMCIQPMLHGYFFQNLFDFIWYVLRFIWIIYTLVLKCCWK